MGRRNYNKKLYCPFAKINKKVREIIRPNSCSCLEQEGMSGKIVSKIIKKCVKKPMHKLNYNMVGKYYNPKVDSPYKASLLYTIFDYVNYGLLGFIIFFVSSIIIKIFLLI